jgi:PAS domain S-box-containing protein
MTDVDEQFRQLVELLPEAFIIQSEDEIVYANPAGVLLLGFEESSNLLGKSIWEFIDPRYKPIIEKRCRQVRERGSSTPPLDLEVSTLAGPSFDVELSAIPFMHLGKPAVLFFLHDITTRKLVEDQIRQRNVELAALNAVAASVSQSLNLGIILNDALECVVQLNILGEGAQGMIFFHEDASDTLSLAAHRGVPEDHPCLTRPARLGECLCGLAVQSGEPVISEDCFKDERHTLRWSTMPPHKDICIPLKVRSKVLGAMNVRLPASKEIDRNLFELLSSVVDQIAIAIENARLFEEIRRQSERLRSLGARLAEAEDAERQRIAMELHDQVGESLTALGINLGIIQKQLSEDKTQGLQPFVHDSLNLVDKTTDRVRDLMSELSPPMLDDFGLMPTLRWYSEQFSDRTGIVVTVSGEEVDPRLPARTEIALFRIATEALTNVAKHAGASQVSLDVEYDETSFKLEISDDGIGFDVSDVTGDKEDRGWGLLTMSERAESVRGELVIESRNQDGGTRVITEVPR